MVRTIKRNILIAGLILASSLSILAQTPVLDDIENLFSGKVYSKYIFNGFVEKSLPITIALGRQNDDLSGYAYYGDNLDRYDIEGTITSSGEIDLYEFDAYSRVSGKIKGNLLKPAELFAWQNIDETLSLNITLYLNKLPLKQVELFESSLEDNYSQIFVREDLKQITIDHMRDINLRWIDFLCEGIHCYENRPNVKLSNPVEFALSVNGKKELLVYPDHKYHEVQTIPYKNSASHSFGSFLSFNYPFLGDIEFDNWISSKMEELTSEIQLNNDDHHAVNHRFSDRYYGDFYITLISNELISGYLFSHNTESNKVTTLPFIFDRDKSKFYKINDLFEKSFDYAFFLEKYLEKIKRGRMIRENRLVQNLLKREDYKHLVLSSKGLLFFTDFNVVFGRRQILVPYDEISSSIDNKAIENYLKKERF